MSQYLLRRYRYLLRTTLSATVRDAKSKEWWLPRHLDGKTALIHRQPPGQQTSTNRNATARSFNIQLDHDAWALSVSSLTLTMGAVFPEACHPKEGPPLSGTEWQSPVAVCLRSSMCPCNGHCVGTMVPRGPLLTAWVFLLKLWGIMNCQISGMSKSAFPGIQARLFPNAPRLWSSTVSFVAAHLHPGQALSSIAPWGKMGSEMSLTPLGFVFSPGALHLSWFSLRSGYYIKLFQIFPPRYRVLTISFIHSSSTNSFIDTEEPTLPV